MKAKSVSNSRRFVAVLKNKPRLATRAPYKRSSPSPQRILVPVDFSPESLKALDYAAALARQTGASLTLLHVVEPIYYVCDYGYGPVTRERPDQSVMKSVRAHLRRLVSRRLKRQVSRCDTVVRSGAAFTEITKTAKDLDMDLILMPTRGLTDAKEVPLGSTAERVVRHAPCPVLTLRKPSL